MEIHAFSIDQCQKYAVVKNKCYTQLELLLPFMMTENACMYLYSHLPE